MSYDLKRSHFSVILERKVATGLTVTEEGLILTAGLDATTGEEVVRVAQGAAAVDEVPAGFAIRDNADNSTTSAVEEATIPAAGTLTVQLSNNNLVGTSPNSQIQVDASTTGILTQVAAGLGAGEVLVDDVTGLLTFDAAQAGEDIVVTYRYNLTVAESRLMFYQRNINNEAGALFGQVGVGHGHGEVYTDQYNAEVDWSGAAVAVWTGAGGILTDNVALAGGTRLDARVISVPNVNNPLLGIAFDIGGRGSV